MDNKRAYELFKKTPKRDGNEETAFYAGWYAAKCEDSKWIAGLPPLRHGKGVKSSDRVLMQDVNDNVFIGVLKKGYAYDFVVIDRTDRTIRADDIVCYQPIPKLCDI